MNKTRFVLTGLVLATVCQLGTGQSLPVPGITRLGTPGSPGAGGAGGGAAAGSGSGSALPLSSPSGSWDSTLCATFRQKSTGATGATAISPKAMPQDSRLVVYAYDANALYPVNAYFNRFTHFEFEPGESVVGSYINDDTEWEMKVAGTGRDVMLRPKVRGATGSMTTITDRRRYQIELFDVSVCASELRYQRVSWTYHDSVYENPQLMGLGRSGAKTMGSQTGSAGLSGSGGFGGVGAALPPLPGMVSTDSGSGAGSMPGRMPMHAGTPSGVLPSSLFGAPGAQTTGLPMVRLESINTEYSVEGDAELLPVSVMDDGQRTVFKFRDAMALRPALFAVGTDGTAETVEYMGPCCVWANRW
jgi:type IV secretory pathway VirB9-like protein